MSSGSPAVPVLGLADDGRRLRLAPGGALRVELPEVATSGLRWRLDQASDPAVLQLLEDAYLPPAGAVAGGQGLHRFAWRAVAPGQAALRWQLKRPGGTAVSCFGVDVEVSVQA